MYLKRIVGLVFVQLLVASGIAAAEEEAEPQSTRYVRVTKEMVLNYGDPSLKRLKYVKFALEARVSGIEGAEVVMHHQPALIDRLVILFSEQDESVIHSAEGKEAVRLEALNELQKILVREEGKPYIQDLLFTRFIVQR